MPINANQYPEVYKRLGIKTSELGCIMADVDPFHVIKHVEKGEEDLFFGDIPELKYAQGAVAEKSAHLTMLFGLMEPGPKWKEEVDAVLEGWEPGPIRIENVGFFPSSLPGQDYSCIIGHIEKTPELLEANARLKLLPHIDTFPESYRPHVTLAYVNNLPSNVVGFKTTREKWIRSLQQHLAGRELTFTGINYGGND